MKRVLLSCIVSLFLVSATFAATKSVAISKPDFAYPQQVTKNAETAFNSSIKSGNDIAALRALIDIALAQGMIDTDNLREIYKRIDKFGTDVKSPAVQSMTRLLQAVILSDIYQNRRYSFDERKIPLLPLSSDWNEWSGDQFRAEIERLIDETLSNSNTLKSTPITDFSSLLTLNNQSKIYYPTLYYFALNRSIELLKDNFPIPLTISSSILDNIASKSFSNLLAINSPIASKILNLYSELLIASNETDAPHINTLLDCIGFIRDYSYAYTSDITSDKGPDLLKKLYQSYFNQTSYSGDILLSLSESDFGNSAKEYYDLLKQFINRYPNYWRSDCIKSSIYNLEKPGISSFVQNFTAPGSDFYIKVLNTNNRQVYLNIYQLKDSGNELLSNTPVFSHKFVANDVIPFSTSDSIKVCIQKPGRYTVVVTPDNKAPLVKRGYSIGNNFTCTSVALGAVSGKKSVVYSFNPQTGFPIGNVDLFTKNQSKEIKLGATDKNGVIELNYNNNDSYYQLIIPRLKDDKYGISTSINYFPSSRQQTPSIKNLSLCDLPLYHPGDSINWETIVYQYSENDNRPVSDLRLQAILHNSNRQAIDTLEVTTDDFGRAIGAFVLPTGELTGNYFISFASLSVNTNNQRANLYPLYFLVSDYKLPTFKVELLKPAINLPDKGDVTLRGRVMSLSGVGVADSRVNLTISSLPRFRYLFDYINGTPFYTDSITTAADGSFSCTIPAQVLDYAPIPDGRFVASVSATSPSGESQESSTGFARGASYSVIASLIESKYGSDIFELSDKVFVRTEVLNAEGNPVNEPILLTVSPENDSNSTDKLTMTLKPGKSQIDLSSLSPGRYRFSFSMADEALRELSDSTELDYTLFKLNDRRSPSNKAIWGCPSKHNTMLKDGETAKIIYAVPDDNSYFVYLLSDGNNIIESKWMKSKSGVHVLDVALPEGVSSAKVLLFGCRDFNIAEYNETISVAKESLEIRCESFRDNLVPGQKETWSFRIVNNNNSPRQAAMILGMYNAALEKFNSLNYNKTFQLYTKPTVYASLDINQWISTYYYNSNSKSDPYDCPSLVFPGFNTYGYSFSRLYQTSRVMMKSMSTAGRIANSEMVFDCAEEAPLTASADCGAALKTEAAVINGTNMDGSIVDEDAEESEQAEPQTAVNNFEYRDGETVLAFFRPLLTTDAGGNLSFSFTVPNVNTTWRLNALAYTQELLSASLSRTFIANKPVMVTPNLPRFLRAGDRAEISSLVVNNSDSTQRVKTTTEIFDALSGLTLHTSQSVDSIAPGQNATVRVLVDAPFDATAIGFRVKSSTGMFADGEQSLLPILPSINPVIETAPFYISPDSTRFEMKLPNIGSDARVTLEYCDNPTWYVVTALPGLRQQKISTPSDAAETIFSAAVAEGILRDYPAVAQALRQWTTSDRSDSTLTSMLQRNADLKTMLLQATPWMVDAMNDTQRMERLALLFDKSEIKDAYSRSIDLLRRLQRADGGWAWITMSSDPSQWATSNALMILGRLNRLGYLPADKSLKTMISQALSWHQKQIEKNYKKYPKQSYYSFLCLRDLWPEFTPSLTGKTIVNSEIQKIVKDWKTFSVGQKAQAALLLAHNRYAKLAQNVLSSIYEFSKSTPEQGMWWPSVGEVYGGSMTQLQISANVLTALQQIRPESNMIDPIRQWLIIQKEARNWGTSDVASEVICAILSSSRKWISKAGATEICIDGRAIPYTSTDSQLGYMRTDITFFANSQSILTINKQTLSPSWGAVYSQSNMTMSDIRPSSCEAVSIEKRLFRLDGKQWVKAENLKVGDRVKIQLLIHANRDMQYIAIDDNRAACLEPIEQLPSPIYSQGVCFYRENRDASTNLFITNMPKGTYMLEYEMWVNNAGVFSSGIATIQSQYAPQLSAHSAGGIITSEKQPLKFAL